MSQHTVILIRHAQAVDHSSVGDIGRVLSAKGEVDAQALGRKLSSQLAVVDTIYVSPAKRAMGTWKQMVRGAGLVEDSLPPVREESIIYGGAPEDIVEMIRLESTGRTVVVVGHEPVISATAALLAGESASVPTGFRTATAMVLSASKDWIEWHSHVADRGEFVRA